MGVESNLSPNILLALQMHRPEQKMFGMYWMVGVKSREPLKIKPRCLSESRASYCFSVQERGHLKDMMRINYKMT